MKKILSLFMTIIFVFSLTACAGAKEPAQKSEEFTLTMQIGSSIMTVNGTETEIDEGNDTAPIIENGRTLVPIRAITEAMGGSVEWDSETQTAALTMDGDTILLTAGSTTAYFNNTKSELDTAPAVINGRTMLPIRFIAESFNFDVDWNAETQTITIKKTFENEEEDSNTVEALTADTVAETSYDKLYITANGITFTAVLADNSSAEALIELLKQGDITINMSDYANFEKVGSLGTTLPRNDEDITTEPGDIILYEGSNIVIYYDTNSWDFTRLGKIENVTGDELISVFGSGNVTVTFSLTPSDAEESTNS